MSPATRTQTVEIDVIGVNDKSLFLLELLSQTLQELLLFLGHPLTVHNLTALGADQVVVELCRTANLVVFPAIAKVDFSENPHAQEKVKIPVHRCYADFLFLCPQMLVHILGREVLPFFLKHLKNGPARGRRFLVEAMENIFPALRQVLHLNEKYYHFPL